MSAVLPSIAWPEPSSAVAVTSIDVPDGRLAEELERRTDATDGGGGGGDVGPLPHPASTGRARNEKRADERMGAWS